MPPGRRRSRHGRPRVPRRRRVLLLVMLLHENAGAGELRRLSGVRAAASFLRRAEQDGWVVATDHGRYGGPCRYTYALTARGRCRAIAMLGISEAQLAAHCVTCRCWQERFC